MKKKFKILIKGFALMGVFGLLLSCGGGGGGGGGTPIAALGGTITLSGAIDGTEAQWARPQRNCGATSPADHFFDTFVIVNQTGIDQLLDLHAIWTQDGYLHIYREPFDPLDPQSNCITGDDDYNVGVLESRFAGVPIAAGERLVILASTFSPNTLIDSYDINVTTIDPATLSQIAIDVKEVAGNIWRGWHVADGTTAHTSANDNTITGDYRTGSNSYFVFNGISVAGSATVVGVTLELELESYNSTDATETFSVWDVSTSAATVEADGVNLAVYDDLMTGINYYPGQTIAASDVTSVLSMPLSAQATYDLVFKGSGDFVVGVHSETEPPGWFRFSASSEPRIHRIIVDYIP